MLKSLTPNMRREKSLPHNSKEKRCCCECGQKEGNGLKKLKRLKCGWYCRSCVKEKRKKHRDYLKYGVAGVHSKRDRAKKWEKENGVKAIKIRKERKKLKKEIIKPIIKGAKVKKKKTSALGLYLTLGEKELLYQKYKDMGKSPREAKERVDKIVNYLNEFIRKMREDKKTQEDMGIKFKEEFAKLISQ